MFLLSQTIVYKIDDLSRHRGFSYEGDWSFVLQEETKFQSEKRYGRFIDRKIQNINSISEDEYVHSIFWEINYPSLFLEKTIIFFLFFYTKISDNVVPVNHVINREHSLQLFRARYNS